MFAGPANVAVIRADRELADFPVPPKVVAFM
jgi:hypothetical protein